MSFTKRLREEIEYSGLLHKEIADKAGIKKRAFDMYVGARESIPPADVAVRIAQVLGVSVEYLVTGKDSHKDAMVPPQTRKLLELFSILDERDKQTVLNLVESLSDRYVNAGETEKSSFPAG